MKKFDGHKDIFDSQNKEHDEDDTSIDNLLTEILNSDCFNIKVNH